MEIQLTEKLKLNIVGPPEWKIVQLMIKTCDNYYWVIDSKLIDDEYEIQTS